MDRNRKILRLKRLFGTGLWHGDLAEMREDTPKVPKKKRRAPVKSESGPSAAR
jgi:hypothetical protein